MVTKEEFHQIWEKFDRKFLHELMAMEPVELVQHHIEVQDSYSDLQGAASRAERYMNDVYKVMKMKQRLQVERDEIEGNV
mgnify:CR=1 FL=1|tara:strand:+ start:221 stop:460 length:240 start_codon:yes stop_codon:yes gene_type:complete